MIGGRKSAPFADYQARQRSREHVKLCNMQIESRKNAVRPVLQDAVSGNILGTSKVMGRSSASINQDTSEYKTLYYI